jgi:signal transduction histidine kinase
VAASVSSFLDKIIPSRRREKQLRATANRLESFLRALPIEYCGWSISGIQALSSGFLRLFDVEKIKTIEDLQDVLDPGDAAALEALFNNLLEYGKDFELTINVASTSRVLKLTGQRGTLSGGEEIFNVIWAFDVTSYVNKITEGLQNLEDLELREEEFRCTLNALPMPVWIRDGDLNLTWVNKSYSHIINDTSAAIIAEQMELPLGSMDSGDSRGPRLLAQRALAQQRAQTQSGFLIMGGSRNRVEIKEIPAGENSVIGCALDISRIEELESEMRHFESSNFEVLEQLRTAIAIYDEDTNLEFYNAAYEQLWGLEGKWLDEKPKVNEIFDRLREKRMLPEQANYKQYKESIINEFSHLMETKEEMMYLPDGKMLRMVKVPRPRGGMLVTFEDVTSRYELETSYNTLVAVQQETLDNLAEGLAVVGEDGLLKLNNPTFAKLWHLDPEDLKNTPHVSGIFEKTQSLFEEEDWESTKKDLINACFNRNGQSDRIHLKNGCIYSYRTMPLPDGNVLVTYTDITDTVKVEQALIEKNAALEAAEKLKMDFLANVSYQLRTPLNAMMGFTEILHEEYFGGLNDRQKSYTENMIQAGHRLITLVDNILDLSTIEAGYLTLNLEDIGIKDSIENVAELTKDWARREGIEIATEYPKEIGTVLADERRFKQVMLHLIRNAIDYTPSGGAIKIIAAKENDALYLTIEDNGVGLPKEDLERIFVPFEKSENKNQKPNKANRHSGAGLGLSLVKHIVELHGGHIDITSEENVGTKVSCVYPLTVVVTEEPA